MARSYKNVIIDFLAQHGPNNANEYFLCTNSKISEKMPCKNEDFWSFFDQKTSFLHSIFSQILEFVHKKYPIALFGPWRAKKSIITFL